MSAHRVLLLLLRRVFVVSFHRLLSNQWRKRIEVGGASADPWNMRIQEVVKMCVGAMYLFSARAIQDIVS